MRLTDLGSNFNVAVSESDIDHFNSRWPASELRGLRGITFQFDKRNGDLIDIWYKNGDSDRWDGPALLALSEDAQKYGEARLGKKLVKYDLVTSPKKGPDGYEHGAPGTGQVCGAANDCTRLKGHEGEHANQYNGRRWPRGGTDSNPAAWAKVFG